MKLNKYITFGLLAFIGFATMISCRKKQDTIAKIIVRDSSNQAVVGARVVLYGESTTSQPASVACFDTTSTNSNGEAIFDFNEKYQLGQAGVAVLNIDVDKGALTGEGIIKVEQEATTQETVFVQ